MRIMNISTFFIVNVYIKKTTQIMNIQYPSWAHTFFKYKQKLNLMKTNIGIATFLEGKGFLPYFLWLTEDSIF